MSVFGSISGSSYRLFRANSTVSTKARLLVAAIFGLLIASFVMPDLAMAQGGGRRGGGGQQQEDPADKEKKEAEWTEKSLEIRKRRADGPCPFVKVLYDAARYHDFEGGVIGSSTVTYSGEINGVASDCAYKGNDPIEIEMVIGFSLGKGPKAKSNQMTYRYWVAVTQRDTLVLAKSYFDLPVTFAQGETVKNVATRIENIVIPRADTKISGSNFEVLIGFDVTPEMAEFNGEGKRFRMVSSEAK